MRTPLLASAIALLAAGLAVQDGEKRRLQETLKDADLPGLWIYDDIPAGLAKARETGRPLLIVFR
jgi:hypothetical protein